MQAQSSLLTLLRILFLFCQLSFRFSPHIGRRGKKKQVRIQSSPVAPHFPARLSTRFILRVLTGNLHARQNSGLILVSLRLAYLTLVLGGLNVPVGLLPLWWWLAPL